MKYSVEITNQAHKQLMALQQNSRERVAERIADLGNNPDNSALDVKPLKGDPEARFRLRVGVYRVKFNREDKLKIISIIRIVDRKEAYKK
jgi:mRNA interferase RelE/StbE